MYLIHSHPPRGVNVCKLSCKEKELHSAFDNHFAFQIETYSYQLLMKELATVLKNLLQSERILSIDQKIYNL